MEGIRIDWVIPAWNIIIAIVFLVTIVVRMAKMETKVDTMWKAFCLINDRRSAARDNQPQGYNNYGD